MNFVCKNAKSHEPHCTHLWLMKCISISVCYNCSWGIINLAVRVLQLFIIFLILVTNQTIFPVKCTRQRGKLSRKWPIAGRYFRHCILLWFNKCACTHVHVHVHTCTCTHLHVHVLLASWKRMMKFHISNCSSDTTKLCHLHVRSQRNTCISTCTCTTIT